MQLECIGMNTTWGTTHMHRMDVWGLSSPHLSSTNKPHFNKCNEERVCADLHEYEKKSILEV